MRDYLVLGFVYGSIPFCFKKPWIGVLVFLFISLANPHRFSWSFAVHAQVAMLVAVPTILGFLVTREKDPFPRERESILLLLFWGLTMVTSHFAIYANSAWSYWQQFSKILLMAFLTTALFIDRKKLKYYFLTIGVSLGLLGAKGGLFSLMTGGRYNVRGPEGTFIENEGDFALALNMALPLLHYLAREEKNVWIKTGLRVLFVFTLIAVVFTYSRGAFLGLSAVLILIFLRSKQKFLAVVAAVLIFFATSYIPPAWYEEMSTMITYEEDGSAMGRIDAWKFAINLARDRPLTGGGFEAFKPAMFDIYYEGSSRYHDAHSNWFEVLGEQGFTGLVLYVSILFSCLWSLQKIRRRALETESGSWMRSYAEMIQVSLVAYMVGGSFVGRAYFDLFYQMVAGVIVLKVLVDRELGGRDEEVNLPGAPAIAEEEIAETHPRTPSYSGT